MSRHPFHLTREEAEVQRLARGFPKFVGKLCLEPVSLPVILPHSWSESGGAPPPASQGGRHIPGGWAARHSSPFLKDAVTHIRDP